MGWKDHGKVQQLWWKALYLCWIGETNAGGLSNVVVVVVVVVFLFFFFLRRTKVAVCILLEE